MYTQKLWTWLYEFCGFWKCRSRDFEMPDLRFRMRDQSEKRMHSNVEVCRVSFERYHFEFEPPFFMYSKLSFYLSDASTHSSQWWCPTSFLQQSSQFDASDFVTLLFMLIDQCYTVFINIFFMFYFKTLRYYSNKG